jgi:hypothetical protein
VVAISVFADVLGAQSNTGPSQLSPSIGLAASIAFVALGVALVAFRKHIRPIYENMTRRDGKDARGGKFSLFIGEVIAPIAFIVGGIVGIVASASRFH